MLDVDTGQIAPKHKPFISPKEKIKLKPAQMQINNIKIRIADYDIQIAHSGRMGELYRSRRNRNFRPFMQSVMESTQAFDNHAF